MKSSARRTYEAALAAELRLVDTLPTKPTKSQIAAAWAAAETTNRALRALLGATP